MQLDVAAQDAQGDKQNILARHGAYIRQRWTEREGERTDKEKMKERTFDKPTAQRERGREREREREREKKKGKE